MDGEVRLLGVDSEYKLTRSLDGEGPSKRDSLNSETVPKRSLPFMTFQVQSN